MTFQESEPSQASIAGSSRRKFSNSGGGMSYIRFDEISQREAKGEPLGVSPEEAEQYQKEKELLNASMRAVAVKAAKPLLGKIRTALKIETPELDALLTSVQSKQRLVDQLVPTPAREPIFEAADHEALRIANETKEQAQQQRMDALVSLAQTQTEALGQMVEDGKSTARLQLGFNMWMLFVAIVAAILAAVAVLK
jgi:hypothetical protein